jgi:hypothetical protein
MAKRQRAVRPGQRRPPTRTATKPATATVAPTPAKGLTGAEEARAAELEAQLVAQQSATATTTDRSRARRSDADAGPRGRTKESGVLAARATLEYAYVTQDIRRIVMVGGSLFILMIAIWLVLTLTGSLHF